MNFHQNWNMEYIDVNHVHSRNLYQNFEFTSWQPLLFHVTLIRSLKFVIYTDVGNLKMTFCITEMRLLEEYASYEAGTLQLEEQSLCSAIDKLSAVEVICPMCKRYKNCKALFTLIQTSLTNDLLMLKTCKPTVITVIFQT